MVFLESIFLFHHFFKERNDKVSETIIVVSCNESISRPLDFDEPFLFPPTSVSKSATEESNCSQDNNLHVNTDFEAARTFWYNRIRHELCTVRKKSKEAGQEEKRNWWWSSYDAFKMIPHDNIVWMHLPFLFLSLLNLLPCFISFIIVLSQHIYFEESFFNSVSRFLSLPGLEFIDALLGFLFISFELKILRFFFFPLGNSEK